MSAIGRIWTAIVGVARGEPALLLALLCGAALRGYQIAEQIVADDEWHALYALYFRSYGDVASHFGDADYSIPLTLLYKALADTVGLTEIAMRAPMLAAGAAAIVAVPLLAREWIGRAASNVLAWLLAIAPLHVYFSRYARPYAFTMLLAVVGVLAFFRWLSGSSRRWAGLYAACAIVAPYCHLAVLPAVLAPLLFGLGDRALRRADRRRSLRELLEVGAGVAAGLAILLTVPFVLDAGSLARKTAASAVRWETLKGTTQLFSGTAHLWLVATVAGLVVIGWIELGRRQPRLAGFVAVVTVCQVAVAVVTRPAGIEVPIVLARYCLPLLPLLLLGAAVGIVQIERAAACRLPVYRPGVLAVAVVALLLVFGPLPTIYYNPNDWTNHALFQYEYDPTSRYSYTRPVRPRRVSPFYERLGTLAAGSLLLVEAPWYYAWHQNPFPYYQAVHRQRMQVGFVTAVDRFVRPGEMPRSAGIRLQNAVHVADAARLRRRQVRYVIFHKSLREEITGGPAEIIDISDWVLRYAERYGPPVYEDTDLVVFDVAG